MAVTEAQKCRGYVPDLRAICDRPEPDLEKFISIISDASRSSSCNCIIVSASVRSTTQSMAFIAATGTAIADLSNKDDFSLSSTELSNSSLPLRYAKNLRKSCSTKGSSSDIFKDESQLEVLGDWREKASS